MTGSESDDGRSAKWAGVTDGGDDKPSARASADDGYDRSTSDWIDHSGAIGRYGVGPADGYVEPSADGQ